MFSLLIRYCEADECLVGQCRLICSSVMRQFSVSLCWCSHLLNTVDIWLSPSLLLTNCSHIRRPTACVTLLRIQYSCSIVSRYNPPSVVSTTQRNRFLGHVKQAVADDFCCWNYSALYSSIFRSVLTFQFQCQIKARNTDASRECHVIQKQLRCFIFAHKNLFPFIYGLYLSTQSMAQVI
jgi:hypothetical protein